MPQQHSSLWVGNLSESLMGRSGTKAVTNVGRPAQQTAGRTAANCLLENVGAIAVTGVRTRQNEKSIVVVGEVSK